MKYLWIVLGIVVGVALAYWLALQFITVLVRGILGGG